jgi:amidophosphoribosyltransferase
MGEIRGEAGLKMPVSPAALPDDRPHEECGVFGIYAPGRDVARLTFFGLYALQHRGQESAGIATFDGESIHLHRQMGLVAQVFDEDSLRHLRGHIAIGHTRYSTTGASRLVNAQPYVVSGPFGRLALAHNGNLVNALNLREELEQRGYEFESTSDSFLIAALFASTPGRTWEERITRSLPRLLGSYSLVVMADDQLIAVRDPMGNRPLCLGRLGEHWVVASESCALQTVGAEFVRDIRPGEMVVIDALGMRARQVQPVTKCAMCLFEYIYFARPDSLIEGRRVYLARKEMGRRLAREHPADADIVIGVPDSATQAALGYAEESGIPYAEGLIKNRYIHRTCIQPEQSMRQAAADLKYNPLPEVLGGKRVVVVDDSIVRGTTTAPLVRLLRRAGATEVHVRISSPPLRHPCYLGVDLAGYKDLIAARMDVEEIRRHIGADSLGYLSLEGLIEAIGLPESMFCNACFTGNYPIQVQLHLDKFVLERPGVGVELTAQSR